MAFSPLDQRRTQQPAAGQRRRRPAAVLPMGRSPARLVSVVEPGAVRTRRAAGTPGYSGDVPCGVARARQVALPAARAGGMGRDGRAPRGVVLRRGDALPAAHLPGAVPARRVGADPSGTPRRAVAAPGHASSRSDAGRDRHRLDGAVGLGVHGDLSGAPPAAGGVTLDLRQRRRRQRAHRRALGRCTADGGKHLHDAGTVRDRDASRYRSRYPREGRRPRREPRSRRRRGALERPRRRHPSPDAPPLSGDDALLRRARGRPPGLRPRGDVHLQPTDRPFHVARRACRGGVHRLRPSHRAHLQEAARLVARPRARAARGRHRPGLARAHHGTGVQSRPDAPGTRRGTQGRTDARGNVAEGAVRRNAVPAWKVRVRPSVGGVGAGPMARGRPARRHAGLARMRRAAARYLGTRPARGAGRRPALGGVGGVGLRHVRPYPDLMAHAGSGGGIARRGLHLARIRRTSSARRVGEASSPSDGGTGARVGRRGSGGHPGPRGQP